MRLLAIIPAYNEEVCIADTVSSLVACCPDVDYVVVNDGSMDRTPQILDELGLNHVDLPVNCGLTCAFQTGMRYAREYGYDAAVQFDADGQHLPEYIPQMARIMQETGVDVVIASRVLAGDSIEGARGIGSKLISKLIELTTGTVITDPTSGMRMYNRKMIELFADAYDLAPEPDAIAMIARKGGRVVEIPAHIRERQGGTSYLDVKNAITYMARTCLSILLFQWFR